MSKIFAPETQPDQRKILLESNADVIEETNYFKPLTNEELDARRETFTDNAIKLSELEDEKKEVLDDLKDRMEPYKVVNKTLLQEIKTRQANVTGKLYLIANHDEGYMETYDEQGEMIKSRRLRPEEKQKNIFSMSKSIQ